MIIYSVIAKSGEDGLTNLCSYDAAHGNYPSITHEILKKIKQLDPSITYRYNDEYLRMHSDIYTTSSVMERSSSSASLTVA